MKDHAFDGFLPRINSNHRTVLIAGGAGFLGSHLCEFHLQQGHSVICVDNFQTGAMANIRPFLGRPNFSLINHDITTPLQILQPVDQIFNMACAASPPGYQKNPVHTMLTNVMGAKHLLDLARDKGARILQSSTSEVYGDPEIKVQVETYRGNVNTCGPRACYDEGKRAAEALFWDYHHSFGVQTRVARIFNTYGPRMHPDDGRVVSNFIRQALKDEPLTVYGDGSQTRSFCFVSDLVAGLVKLMNSEETEPVNLGNPTEITMLELANIIRRKTNSESKIVHLRLPTDDPKQRRPDICRAKTLLGWQPAVAFEDGLAQMIDWYRSELDGARLDDALVS
ncbi:UDP-glucuronate decarboxylase [Yoonia tamlensis]|uniref:UDP-glucuronate decarboxylase n=1 Tax=Yoonia tamlensis TaxID=390270 RepID=A0A1I6GNI9_9RHOB|nr:UDP-glucuronic acid decarboxylase family protein [Yoonia tamlensis]SFR43738.1 UDP-glucuronate decarboxylase [Yoonia tamlensis]